METGWLMVTPARDSSLGVVLLGIIGTKPALVLTVGGVLLVLSRSDTSLCTSLSQLPSAGVETGEENFSFSSMLSLLAFS